MRVLLISTYELGHQPIHLASPAAALLDRGHEVTCFDTSVDPWDIQQIAGIDLVAISVPMHTAMRLAMDLCRRIRSDRAELPICLYGLYAGVAQDHVLGVLADRVISGEYETALCDWVDGQRDTRVNYLRRQLRGVPARFVLPPLARYATLLNAGGQKVAAAVQTSHGCASRCRHCPVPAVYDGRLRIVAERTVLDDIDQAVALGAAHITFADPDFFNGPHHSLRIVRTMHRLHPDVTFDVTTKIEHILGHRDTWAELGAAGCLFVTTALECVEDTVLTILDKGHTASDAAAAVKVLREAGIEPRPSLLPFTPWTTTSGLADLIEFVVRHDLVDGIDPVHWTIRLLIPDGSLLLNQPDLVAHLGVYDPDLLGWQWHAADPEIDVIQRDLTAIVDSGIDAQLSTTAIFRQIAERVAHAVGRPAPRITEGRTGGPRLSETWFCCAEPTCQQRTQILS